MVKCRAVKPRFIHNGWAAHDTEVRAMCERKTPEEIRAAVLTYENVLRNMKAAQAAREMARERKRQATSAA